MAGDARVLLRGPCRRVHAGWMEWQSCLLTDSSGGRAVADAFYNVPRADERKLLVKASTLSRNVKGAALVTHLTLHRRLGIRHDA